MDYDKLEKAPSFEEFSRDFQHVKEICDSRRKIPTISLDKASAILHKLRPNVNDFYSITALHYINGGPEALLY